MGARMTFRCEVYISPRADILDPQGDAISRALTGLGFAGASDVKVGKYLTLALEAGSQAEAEATLREMCNKLLANPITEDYTLKVAAQ
jgi:phosphoribosylformylglycinamidine synthase subunit PurS